MPKQIITLTNEIYRLWCPRVVRGILDMPAMPLEAYHARFAAANQLQLSGVQLDMATVGQGLDVIGIIQIYMARMPSAKVTDQGMPLSLDAKDFPRNKDLQVTDDPLCPWPFLRSKDGSADGPGALNWGLNQPVDDGIETGSFYDQFDPDGTTKRWAKIRYNSAPGQTIGMWARVSQ